MGAGHVTAGESPAYIERPLLAEVFGVGLEDAGVATGGAALVLVVVWQSGLFEDYHQHDGPSRGRMMDKLTMAYRGNGVDLVTGAMPGAGGGYTIATGLDMADAIHIVRCVNSHDELVAGLKLALEAIEDECAYQEKHRGGATELLWRSRDEVRGLLAKLAEDDVEKVG